MHGEYFNARKYRGYVEEKVISKRKTSNTMYYDIVRFVLVATSLCLVACAPLTREIASSDSVGSSSSSVESYESIDPLPRTDERPILKPFGIHITRENSPVKPERFSGYHTGIDFEILPGEEESDVEVRAICNGAILQARRVSGYGGVLIQSCALNDEAVTVLYGHLDLSSVTHAVGDVLRQGNRIGVLGNPSEGETDGERKHLHLGVHRGTSIELRGYAPRKEDLSRWIEPANILSVR